MYLYFGAGVIALLGYAQPEPVTEAVLLDAALATYARLLCIKERLLGEDDASVAEIVDKMACIKGNLGKST
jgi:hypothetical protein